MCGIDSYPLRLEPQLVCDTEDLDALMNVDALVITLPARRTGAGEGFYLQAVQEIVDTALAYHIPRIVFTSSTSVYGNVNGTVKENSPRLPQTASGQVLKELEGLAAQPAGDVGRYSAPGRAGGAFPPSGTFFRRQVGAGWPARGQSGAFAGCGGRYRTAAAGPEGRAHHNLCAPRHPARGLFYPQMARELGLPPPLFSDSPDGGQGKIVDGNRICNELGFEYQYPDPLVMPME